MEGLAKLVGLAPEKELQIKNIKERGFVNIPPVLGVDSELLGVSRRLLNYRGDTTGAPWNFDIGRVKNTIGWLVNLSG